MRILPAIDLHDQMCVRLVKGDYATAHKVAEDAVDTAKAFLDAGAEQIHMVDLIVYMLQLITEFRVS